MIREERMRRGGEESGERWGGEGGGNMRLAKPCSSTSDNTGAPHTCMS